MFPHGFWVGESPSIRHGHGPRVQTEVSTDMRASNRPGGRFRSAADQKQAQSHRIARVARIPAIALLAVWLVALALLVQASSIAPHLWPAQVAQAAGNPGSGPSLTLVSPSSGQGPVGAHVAVSGSGWTVDSVAIGAAQSATNCVSSTTWTATFTTVSASGGSFTTTFTWPSSLSSGSYALCAAPSGSSGPASAGVAATQSYAVKASSPPALTLSSYTVQVGQSLTINGSNFVGVSSVNLSFGTANTGMTPIQPASPDGNGNFAVQFQPNGPITGNVTISAASPPDPGAQQPALSATASLVIAPAPAATATPSPSPSPSPTSAPTATSAIVTTTTPNQTNSGGSNGLIIFLIVGIVLSLLVILGAVAFVLLRRRGGPEQGYPGSTGGPGGGFSGTGPVTSYGQSAPGYGPAPTGRYSATGTYGRGAIHDVPEPYADPQVGGVAQWDERDPLPGADWQPRPMSGSRARFDDPGMSEYPTTGYPPDGYVSGQPGEPVPAPVPDYYGPPDPWANAAGAFGGDARGNNPFPPRAMSRYNGAPLGPEPRDPWAQRGEGGWDTQPSQDQPGEHGAGSRHWQPPNPDEQW